MNKFKILMLRSPVRGGLGRCTSPNRK